MEKIISPIDKSKIISELTDEVFVRNTNFGSNKIYAVTHKNAPYTVQEIGRLREVTFREAGGGTGKSVDLDEFDLSDNPYIQIIVWDPEAEEILGGYRYTKCKDTRNENGEYNLATTELFDFSESFKNDYLPYIIELGRSFVQPAYQSRQRARKGMFALDNLWDGLGAIVKMNQPEIKYLYGKVTMYLNYNKFARDLILYFMDKHFGDRNGLITPKKPLQYHNDINEIAKIFTANTYKENYKILSKKVRELGENIPPLINSYMNLSPTMKSFGTALNVGFGNVEETGILITIDDVYPEKKERHINSYQKRH